MGCKSFQYETRYDNSSLIRDGGDVGHFEAGNNIYDFTFSQLHNHFFTIIIGDREILGLTFEDENLLLDLAFYDDDGKTILLVERGEMTISTGVWDYRIEGPNITIHSAERNIGLDMTVLQNGVNVRRGTASYPPHKIVITPDLIVVMSGQTQMRMSETHITDCRRGFVVR